MCVRAREEAVNGEGGGGGGGGESLSVEMCTDSGATVAQRVNHVLAVEPTHSFASPFQP